VKLAVDKVNHAEPKLPFGMKSTLLFVFDLSKFDTFKKIQIYYEELDRQFDIPKNHFKALIGNKVDKKRPFTHEEKEMVVNFINYHGFKYYEITTKMIFNFEKFFEAMFFELYINQDDFFRTQYFQERFTHILNCRQTFPKAERVTNRIDDGPGPSKYDSNVYDLDQCKLLLLYI